MCSFPGTALVASAAQAIAAGRSQSRMAEREAAYARQQAAFQRQSAALEERQRRRANSALAGRQRARFAGSGIDPAFGSALLSQQDLAAQAALDELTIRAVGEARARGSEHAAALRRTRASAARTNAVLGAGSRLLSSAPYFQER
jgi:hypothetical protein